MRDDTKPKDIPWWFNGEFKYNQHVKALRDAESISAFIERLQETGLTHDQIVQITLQWMQQSKTEQSS